MGFTIFFDMLFWSVTFTFLGKALLGITVINVHAHIIKEHRIDSDVLSYMKKERYYGITGVVFITIGYLLELSLLGYLFF